LLKVKYYPVVYYHPDIFHLQWAKGIEDWIWVKEFGIKLMVSLRGAHINYSPLTDIELQKKYNAFFPLVDGFHAVSEAIKKEAMKYNAAATKIKVVYSGLALNNLQYQIKNYSNNNTLQIISVGRNHWIKGYTYALSALEKLKKTGASFHYTIVGVHQNEELCYLRDTYNLKKEVTFINTLPFQEVVNYINKSDVLLLPSVEEGIANVALEAMALGTVVISTDCGGMQELIQHNINGFIVPLRNARAMTSALNKVANLSVDEYVAITKTARKTIESKHNQQKMVSDMKKLYVTVVNS
jgi:colanic acid/amylovoran biosynthesis glycosyltransferase